MDPVAERRLKRTNGLSSSVAPRRWIIGTAFPWDESHGYRHISLREKTQDDKCLEFRSALMCDAAQKLGYRNVHSLVGGYKGMVAAGWPMKSG